MAFCSNHNRIYFDSLCRTKKAETLLSLIHATYQTKINNERIDQTEKEVIAQKLEYAYELFKFDSGTYSGSLSAFSSQYTIGHEMGIWENSELDLTALATKVATNSITIKDFISVVFLNYIQPVNGKIVHILHCLLTYMYQNNLSSITKDQMATAYNSYIPNCAPTESVAAVFNFMLATNYFEQVGNQKLVFNSDYDIKKVIELCDITYLDETKYTCEQVQEHFSDLTVYLKYLLNEHIDEDTSEISENIFDGFRPWLTTYNNPDYHGVEQYKPYPSALKKLIQFMFENGLIEDDDLNELNLDKYLSYLDIYEDSEEAKTFDKKGSYNGAGIAALKKYVKYIEYLLNNYKKLVRNSKPDKTTFDYHGTKGNGINKIFYGVPGCGKSYHIKNVVLKDYAEENIIRTTFYQDYSNTDFVGQILPKIVKGDDGEKDTVEYIFNPGPFTLAFIQAISNPTKKVALVVEEINRGNAPAIFGDIFQLLDRDENGISEYGIKNVSMIDYLNDHTFDVNGEKKNYIFKDIKIPGNLYIYATMNTSDQNVYTLDTAFTRRWGKERIPNKFNDTLKIKDMLIPGMSNVNWEIFVTTINDIIRVKIDELQVNEDKQIGVFFVKESDLIDPNKPISEYEEKEKVETFAYKVLEYLWDDVSKLDHSVIFNPSYITFSELVEGYIEKKSSVFSNDIAKVFAPN